MILWLKIDFWRGQKMEISNFICTFSSIKAIILKHYLLDLDDWDINVAIQENNEHEPQNFGPPARKLRFLCMRHNRQFKMYIYLNLLVYSDVCSSLAVNFNAPHKKIISYYYKYYIM